MRLTCVVLLSAGLAPPALAAATETPKLELFAGYAQTRLAGDEPRLEPEHTFHGAEATLGWSLGSGLSLIADASRHEGELSGARLERRSLMAGPRLALRTRAITFFFHALGGAVWTSESLRVVDLKLVESTRDRAVTFGGGLDLRLAAHWALRLQDDLTLIRSGRTLARKPHMTAGLVFRGGRR